MLIINLMETNYFQHTFNNVSLDKSVNCIESILMKLNQDVKNADFSVDGAID